MPESIPALSQVWMRSQAYMKAKDYESAYRLILTQGDDMSLLRLMLESGPVTQHLSPITAQQAVHRLNLINRTAVFPTALIEWIDDSLQSTHF